MWFKVAFMLAFVYAVGVAVSAARRAARRHGGTFNQLHHEIPGLLAVRAALGLVFYTTLIAWLFFSRALMWTYLPVPPTGRWLATVLLIPLLAFFSWSFRCLGTNYRGGIGLYTDHELVTHGPYHWIRHPIYLAFVGMMLLVLMLSANWVLGGSGLLLVVSIAAARIPTEERELHARFGLAWERYRSHTGCMTPRLLR